MNFKILQFIESFMNHELRLSVISFHFFASDPLHIFSTEIIAHFITLDSSKCFALRRSFAISPPPPKRNAKTFDRISKRWWLYIFRLKKRKEQQWRCKRE